MSETTKRYECKCNDPGFIIIDITNNNVICGTKGVVDQGNVRLSNGTATCVCCNTVIYEFKGDHNENR